MHKFSHIAMRYLCGALFISGSFNLNAEEMTSSPETETLESTQVMDINQEQNQEQASDQSDKADKYLQAGERALSPSEHLAFKKHLAAERSLGIQKTEQDHAPLPGLNNNMHSPLSGLLNTKAAVFSTYYTTHPGAFHQPFLVTAFGESVQLEDGSIWSVNPNDSYKTLNWLTSDIIWITPNSSWFSSYNYCLVNQNTGVAVEVNLSLFLNPVSHSFYNHRIIAIDDYRAMIWLEDGSVWSVYSMDYSSRWQLNDTVIIGINDGWFADTRPNILINANITHYVRAACIQY